jgi:DNA adenine methylase
MQYMGGKSRQAKHIAGVLSAYAGTCRYYVEPFLGGASVFERAAGIFLHPVGSDVHPDLILMWQALLDGWLPPDAVTREEYNELRTAEPSPLRGFVGFGCSYGGKWFGGYAYSAGGRDYCGGSKRVALRKARAMSAVGATVHRSSYLDLDPLPGTLVYCDPPYAGTTKYNGTNAFDHGDFWARARGWADAGAVVVVSEYSAPAGVKCIGGRPAMKSLRRDTNLPSTEKLFVLDSSTADIELEEAR